MIRRHLPATTLAFDDAHSLPARPEIVTKDKAPTLST